MRDKKRSKTSRKGRRATASLLSQKVLLEELEPRILFSAGVEGVFSHNSVNADANEVVVDISVDDFKTITTSNTLSLSLAPRLELASETDALAIEEQPAKSSPLNYEPSPSKSTPLIFTSDAAVTNARETASSLLGETPLKQRLANFVVSNTNDSGAGSLRQAILDANTAGGADTITFSIGSGAQTINLLSDLPIIADTVTLDATTQSGYAGTPLIEINASGVNHGLNLGTGSDASLVRGFVINNATLHGINIAGGSGGHTIAGNYIGTDASGNVDAGVGNYGIFLSNSSGGNFIGGTGVNDGNVIAGNDVRGIYLFTGDNNTVFGNNIGVGADGSTPIGNGVAGISINTSDNIIGGLALNAGNIVANHSDDGVDVLSGTGNTISGNLIHGNGDLGIDLSGLAVTLNDTLDGDSGSNNLQNFPVLYSANTDGAGSFNVSGTLNSNASLSYRIEFFSNPATDASGHGEGQTFLGSVNVSTDASGNANFDATISTTVAIGSSISATAISTSFPTLGDTSEFAENVIAQDYSTAVVTTTSDVIDGSVTSLANLINNKGADGVISLREAITAANNTTNGGSADKIYFDIKAALASGVHTILPNSSGNGALPTITDSVIIDATSEPDFSGAPVVELAGTAAGAGVIGLTVSADDVTVRGLIVNQFSSIGIGITGDNNTIAGNFIGTDVTGTLDRGNTLAGLQLYSSAETNTIGGTTAADRNVISGNGQEGINISGGDNNIISGNYIGVTAAGNASLGNKNGVSISGGASGNVIGGTTVSARNVISGNTSSGLIILGVGTTANTIAGNYVGINAAGTDSVTNTNVAIQVGSDANGNIIGGTTTNHRNVIAGESIDGIRINGADNTQILSNYIGTDAAGTASLGFNQEAIEVNNASGTIIGAIGQGNLISGNSGAGIGLQTAATNTVIKANLIGTDASGSAALPNTNDGIQVTLTASSNTIGGTIAGEGNTIAFNTGDGVAVTSSGLGNAIRGNSIHSNTQLGVDLGTNGVNANDLGDGDTGANNLQNTPVLSAFSSTDGISSVAVTGTLNSTVSTTFDVDFYSSLFGDADPSGSGEGRTYIGTTTVVTDGSGDATFDVSLSAAVPANQIISAIATDPAFNSSEFSGTSIAVSDTVVVDTVTDVSNDGDTSSIAALNANKGSDGFISLREAIIATNNSMNGANPDKILFDIAGSGPHTINLTAALPDIDDAVVIDGWSEPDYVAGAPVIELSGAALVGTEDGLRLDAGSGGSTIRGLIINRFSEDGIDIADTSGGNTIVGNWVGINNAGTADCGLRTSVTAMTALMYPVQTTPSVVQASPSEMSFLATQAMESNFIRPRRWVIQCSEISLVRMLPEPLLSAIRAMAFRLAQVRLVM
ncbi:MAG: beta strand repeat-containing protein [Pseudomonadales bacterium]